MGARDSPFSKVHLPSSLSRAAPESGGFCIQDRPPLLSPVPPVLTDSAMGGLDEPSELSGTVLLVEDNPVNLLIAIEMLQSLGLDVIEAEDGAQALEQIARNPVDLVLMDCQMPVMDGYTATRHIRERERELDLPRLPIIALTADAFDEDMRQSEAAGMDAHLSKPYTRGQLRAMLTRWL